MRLYVVFVILILFPFFNTNKGKQINNLSTNSSICASQISDDKDLKFMYLNAQDLYNYEYYNEALTIFLRLLKTDKQNCNLNFYVGACYLFSKGQRTKAIEYLEKAILKTNIAYSYSYKETSAPVFAFLYLGQAYHLNSKWDEALIAYDKFKSFLTNKSKDAEFINTVDHFIEMTNQAKKNMASPVNVKITPFKIANSTSSELSLISSPDGITYYFSSKRKGAMGGVKDNFGEFLADIYYTQYKDGKYITPKKLAFKINSTNSDIINYISADNKKIYLSRETKNSFDIFVSVKSKKNKWTPPEKLGININSKDNETWAFISADGTSILFSSDRPGGYGGYDIYMADKISNEEWGVPYNLGPEINTKYDEICPFLMIDGTLYFSSKGHETMGGYDIFESELSSAGLWTKPENMGYPLNTVNDDFNFTPTENNWKKGFYTTSKVGGFGETDIFQYSFE